jgi:hypothetical protein
VKREKDPTHLSARVEGYVARVPLVRKGNRAWKRRSNSEKTTNRICYL